MKIQDIIFEQSMSDVHMVLSDVRNRLRELTSATASPQDYINQVGIKFKLYADDSEYCTVYFEIKSDPSGNRAATERKFQRKIISAAIAAIASASSRPTNLPNYTNAKSILKSHSIGRKAIATLTNPNEWTMVNIDYGNVKWKNAA